MRVEARAQNAKSVAYIRARAHQNPENQVNEHFKSLFRRIEMKQQTKPATFQ